MRNGDIRKIARLKKHRPFITEAKVTARTKFATNNVRTLHRLHNVARLLPK